MILPNIPPIDPHEVPRDPIDRQNWAIGELKKRGLSFRALSVANNYSHSYVSRCMLIPLAPAEAILAHAFGTTPAVLFPERHDASGKRLNRRNSWAENRVSNGVRKVRSVKSA